MSLVPLENYQSEQHQDVWENLKKFTDARIAWRARSGTNDQIIGM